MKTNRSLLVIPGLPRCATTSLVNLLAQNDLVKAGKQKEPHYFLPSDFKKIAYSIEMGRRKHFDKLGFCNTEKEFLSNYTSGGDYFIDASTLYSTHPDSIKFIKNYTNKKVQVKFIIMYRNGFNRAYSHYQFSKTRGEEVRSFNDCLEDELSLSFYDGWLLKGYIHGSRIKPVYEEIVGSFGLGSVYIVNLDKTKIFSEDFMREIEGFLDVKSWNYDFEVYSNGSEQISSNIFQNIRVLLRKIRQVNPVLFDNRITRKFFENFMAIVPKVEVEKPNLDEFSNEIIKNFNNIDVENEEVFRTWSQYRIEEKKL
jgi:hypothetical protein